ncbi:MAG TPA: TetR/AcrR family transcriptional regulator [Burkholderiaceae bacterium]|nr:TetR/AcrR family transcriptional regulator [Burkholderiaceae bacterium]
MSDDLRPLSEFLHQVPVDQVLKRKRWTRDDWVVFGLDILEKEGTGGIRIEELARRSGRTPGSFYAHFKSRDELMEAMLKAWLDFKVARMMRLDSQLFHEGDFSLESLATQVVQGGVMARMQLEIAIRELAINDDRARQVVMQVDTHRLHNATAMLNAEFPNAPHPQVFAMLFLWMNYGRQLAFIDTSDTQLADSAQLALPAFVRMYQSTAGSFKVRGAPKWKSTFKPLTVEVLRAVGQMAPAPEPAAPPPSAPTTGKRRRRSPASIPGR